MAFIRFARLAYRKAKLIPKLDLCYAMSTPLSVGWVAKRLKKTKGIPYIFEVGDLWPEAPIQMGVVKSSLAIQQLRKFEKSVYQDADSVVALSPGIRDGIRRSSPGSSVSIIPNMSDCQFYQIEAKDPQLELRFGVNDKTVVTYFGAAGRANHLEYFIEAAKASVEVNQSLHFLVAAAGSELNRIQNLASQYALNNLTFLPYCNRSELKKILNITDAVYVSYADVPVLATGSPNKYFDGLAAGKLMLVNFSGWLREITERHGLGYYVDPKQPIMLAKKLDVVIKDPAVLQKTQQNARMVAETFFSRALAVQKLLRTIGDEYVDLPKVT